MIDFEKIGKRILEERKYLHRISQEKMAEDLGMYQADISNLEKAKNGSGITDLAKLDMIADYFEVPLETLLFGRRQDQMEKYYGTKMQLKECEKKHTRKHESILRNLLGLSNDKESEGTLNKILSFECGPYMVYVVDEYQFVISGARIAAGNDSDYIIKDHLYVVYQDEVIGCMTAAKTIMMQHVFQPAFEKLKSFIWPDIFDLDDSLQVLNPYWLLSQYAVDEKEQEKFERKMYERMDKLREAGEDRAVLYVESAYVREDCRRNGIFRMMIDVLKKMNGNALIWLSLEPTSGAELSSEYGYHAVYEASELGQINLNASIAEHLGFMIDSKTTNCQAERIEDDGTVVVDTVPVRRTAYYLPQKIRNILNSDHDLISYARARKKTIDGDYEKPTSIEIFKSAWKEQGYIMSIKLVYSDETVYAFARGMDWKTHWLGVSKDNPASTGDYVETIEKYECLKDAENSKYYLGLKVAEQLLGAICFGTVKIEDVQLSELQ